MFFHWNAVQNPSLCAVLAKGVWGCSWKGGCTRLLAVCNLPSGAWVSRSSWRAGKVSKESQSSRKSISLIYSVCSTHKMAVWQLFFCAWSSFILTLREICNYFWLRFKAEMQCIVYVRVLCQCECICMCALIDCSYGFSSHSLPALQHRFSCYP